MNYISPCNHTESFLSGSTIEFMMDKAAKMGLKYFSATDIGHMASSVRGYEYAKKKGLKFIAGVEIYFKDSMCEIIADTKSEQIRYFRLIIHAKDQEAFQKLIKMVSTQGKKNININGNNFYLFDWKDLEEISRYDVTITNSNVEDIVTKHLLVDEPQNAYLYYKKLKHIFGNRYYPSIIPYQYNKYWKSMVKVTLSGDKEVFIPSEDQIETDSYKMAKAIELTRRGNRHKYLKYIYINKIRYPVSEEFQEIKKVSLINRFEDLPSGDIQTKSNKYILAFAQREGDLDRLLINDYSFYAEEADQVVQSMKLGEGNRVEQKQHMRDIDEVRTYLKEYLTMSDELIDKCVQNSYDWAKEFDGFELKYEYKLPDGGENPKEKLLKIIDEVGRMKWDDERYVKQFEEELELISNNGVINLIPYFLPIVDIYKSYKDNGFLTGPSRGCLTGDTHVYTKNGIKLLKDVEIGDYVITHTGRYKRVTKTMKYDVSKETLLDIKTFYGFNGIKLTKDHKLLGIKKSNLEKHWDGSINHKKVDLNDSSLRNWYKAEEFEKGDLLFTPFNKDRIVKDIKKFDLGDFFKLKDEEYVYSKRYYYNNITIRSLSKKYNLSRTALQNCKKGKRNNPKYLKPIEEALKIEGTTLDEWRKTDNSYLVKFKRYIKVDEKFCNLIGRWVGDGWTTSKDNSWGLCFNTDEIEDIEYYTNYLKELGFDLYENKTKNKKLVQYTIRCKEMCDFFHHLFPNYKHTSNSKYLNNFRHLPNNKLIWVLNGLIGADGYIRNNVGSIYKRHCIDTTSYDMLLELKEILLNLHIPSSIHTRKPRIREGKYLCKTSYKIKFALGENNIKTITEDGYYSSIFEKEEINADYVYDITVEDDNSYLTTDFVVHNSAGGFLISFLIGITHIDPIKYDLSSARFLTLDRVQQGNLPDIDCFHGDTKILTEDGYKSIKELSKTKQELYPNLKSYKNGKLFDQKPLLIFKKGYKEVFEFELSSGKKIRCTEDHKVLTRYGWYEIKECFEKGLEIVSFLDNISFMIKILSKKSIGYHDVYDISMPEVHNFIAEGVVVHNCDLESRDHLVGKDGNGGFLFKRWGNKAAQISTRTLLRIKSAILDANRFVNKGKLEPEIQSFSKTLPHTPQGVSDQDFVFGYDKDDGTHEEGLIEVNEDLQKYAKERPEEWEIVKRALSIPRQNSRHACAFIVSNRAIEEDVPVFEVGGVKRVTQYEHKYVEKAGLIKYDFLVVDAIKKARVCLDYINKRNKDFDMETGYFTENGKKIFVWDLPEDQNVFKMLWEGKTETIFQLHSATATPLVMDIKPTSVLNCAAIMSLGRPGPLDFIDEKTGRNMAQEYAFRKKGLSKGHLPILDEMLPETKGILCVAKDSIVKVRGGNKKIQDVKIGDYVQTEDGSYQKVLNNFYRGKKKTIKVITDNAEELFVTPDHKVLTNRGWIEAKDLTDRDLIKHFWASEESIPEGSDYDWCLGLLLADGDLGGPTPNIACSTEDFANKVKKIFDDTFGYLDCRVRFHTRCWYVDLTYKKDFINDKENYFYKNKNPLRVWLEELGLNKKRFHNKFIPHISKKLIEGFIEGDGGLLNQRIRIKNTVMAKQLFYGLQALKIKSYYHKDDQETDNISFNSNNMEFKIKENNIKKGRKGVYYPKNTVNIKIPNQDSRCQYFYPKKRNTTPFISEYALKGICDDYNYNYEFTQTWSKVLRIKESDVVDVYDLSVENNHSFVVGGLVVHNCYQEQVSRLAKDLAGMNIIDAENVRIAVGKKKKKLIDSLKPKFIEGATKKVGIDQATEIWDMMETFARYGFNKCLAGDTLVYRGNNGGGNSKKSYTLKELYDMMHSKDSSSIAKKIRRLGYGNILALDEDNRIRPKKIKDIVYNGEKEVFLITLSSGKTVKATSNHRFLTNRGWLEVAQIKDVDKIATQGSYEKHIKKRYSYDLEEVRRNKKPYNSHKMGFQKGEDNFAYVNGNNIRFKQIVEDLKDQNSCSHCSVYFNEFMKPEHHHVDGDCENNIPSNIEKLCNSCHKKADYKLGLRKKRFSKGYPLVYEDVVSIESVGIEDTYDVEMEENPHAFIANGFVSHNSHAVAYSVISYTCAYFKYHYPLEWWAAVISTSPSKKINEEYYQYIKDMVLPPDINISTEEISIDYSQKKLRAKLSMIKGLGKKIAESITKNRPYRDLKDFVMKKPCGYAITRKLIHVGVLDSFFEPNSSVLKKMQVYEDTLNQVLFEDKIRDYDNRIAVAEDDKARAKLVRAKDTYIKKGVKKGVVEDKYIMISPKNDYLMKKEIFPTMNLDLNKVLEKQSNLTIVKGRQYNRVIDGSQKEYALVSGEHLQRIDGMDFEYGQSVEVVCPSYVIDMEEFTYGGGEKKALKLILDSSGYVSEKVLWADYDSGVLEYPKDLKKGSIAYFFYKRRSNSKGVCYTNIVKISVE